jgi:hypothetical protein
MSQNRKAFSGFSDSQKDKEAKTKERGSSQTTYSTHAGLSVKY